MTRRVAPIEVADRTPVAVALDRLAHSYMTPEGALTVLDGVSLDVGPGEFIAISGSSGSGKTTLLSILGGLDRAQTGRVVVGDVEVSTLGGDELAAYRRTTVGFVFQDFGLLSQLTALENVELALSFSRVSRARRRARARELLTAVGLEHRARHRPHALSGGESQRVAIARALANQPRLLLADEPTGNLDAHSTEIVLDVLEQLPRDRACTVVVATHDPLVAARADRTLHLHHGRLDEA
jgi:putative ABC transport system ATP-binding protein